MGQQAAPPSSRPRKRLRRWLLPSWGERKRVLAAQAWVLVIASYAASAFALLFPHDFSRSGNAYAAAAWVAFMIRTFLFHLGLVLVAVAIAAALLRRWRLLLVVAPLVVLTAGPSAWSLIPKRRPAIAGEAITVMSANLLFANRKTDGIIGEVVAARPDVLLLQECTRRWHRAFQAALGEAYPYSHYVCREDSFGTAIYSRRPFVQAVDSKIRMGTIGLPQTRAVVRIGDRDVAVYNIHLLPPKGPDWALEQRRAFADLLELVKEDELPIVLCGDFNFTNASAFADRLERLGVVDAHRIVGWGRGATWPVAGLFRYVPGVRIDHMFLSEELTSTSSRTGTGEGSDHRPIVATVGLAVPDE